MGLLDKVREKVPKKAPEMLNRTEWVNISGSAIRVEVPDGDEGAYYKGGHLWKEGNKLRAFQGDTLLFEITSRSKAFDELDEFVGKELRHIIIRKRRSDYGIYYGVAIGTKLSADEYYR